MANQFTVINKHIQGIILFKVVVFESIAIVLSKNQTIVENEKSKILFSRDVYSRLLLFIKSTNDKGLLLY